MTTPDFNGFRGAAKRLTEGDILVAARSIGVTYAAMRAIVEVESAGSGYYKGGVLKTLFEPLYFYKGLVKKHGAASQELNDAVAKGVATAQRPSGGWYKTHPVYRNLEIAMAIDWEVALESASWGLGQVMGANFKSLGYTNVEKVVRDMMDSEGAQVAVMAAFLKVNKLVPAMNARDWSKVARGYNGPGYARDGYHTKLAAAFAKWNAKALPGIPSDNPDGPTMRTDGDLPNFIIKGAQARLLALHYFQVGVPDGIMGPRTASAITAFQVANGIDVSGVFDDETMKALETAGTAPIEPERASISMSDLRPQSEVLQKQDTIKTASVVQGVAGVGTIAASAIGSVQLPDTSVWAEAYNWIVQIKSAFADLPVWVYGVGFLVIAIVIWLYAHRTQVRRLQDERIGKITSLPAGVKIEPPRQIGSPSLSDDGPEGD